MCSFSYQLFGIFTSTCEMMVLIFIFVSILSQIVLVSNDVAPDLRELNATVLTPNAQEPNITVLKPDDRKPNATILREIFGKKFSNFTEVEELLKKNLTEKEKQQSMKLASIFRRKYHVGRGTYMLLRIELQQTELTHAICDFRLSRYVSV